LRGNKWLNFALLAALSLIWGSSFILMKRGLEAFAPSQVASLRILFSGLIMLPIVIINLKRLKFRQFKFILLFGVLNAGIPPFLFANAQTVLPSSTAGVLNALTPLFTLLTGALMFKVQLSFQKNYRCYPWTFGLLYNYFRSCGE
jgi:drug/metabolite transporter (DMT)-like permease